MGQLFAVAPRPLIDIAMLPIIITSSEIAIAYYRLPAPDRLSAVHAVGLGATLLAITWTSALLAPSYIREFADQPTHPLLISFALILGMLLLSAPGFALLYGGTRELMRATPPLKS